jgi:hypothetical protein
VFKKPRGTLRLRRPLIVAALALLALPGCAPPQTTQVESHVVWQHLPECPYLVARTLHRGFALLGHPPEFVPRRGDLLIGSLRPGRVRVRLYPVESEVAAGDLEVNVLAFDTPLDLIQDAYRVVCNVPPG